MNRIRDTIHAERPAVGEVTIDFTAIATDSETEVKLLRLRGDIKRLVRECVEGGGDAG